MSTFTYPTKCHGCRKQLLEKGNPRTTGDDVVGYMCWSCHSKCYKAARNNTPAPFPLPKDFLEKYPSLKNSNQTPKYSFPTNCHGCQKVLTVRHRKIGSPNKTTNTPAPYRLPNDFLEKYPNLKNPNTSRRSPPANTSGARPHLGAENFEGMLGVTTSALGGVSLYAPIHPIPIPNSPGLPRPAVPVASVLPYATTSYAYNSSELPRLIPNVYQNFQNTLPPIGSLMSTSPARNSNAAMPGGASIATMAHNSGMYPRLGGGYYSTGAMGPPLTRGGPAAYPAAPHDPGLSVPPNAYTTSTVPSGSHPLPSSSPGHNTGTGFAVAQTGPFQPSYPIGLAYGMGSSASGNYLTPGLVQPQFPPLRLPPQQSHPPVQPSVPSTQLPGTGRGNPPTAQGRGSNYPPPGYNNPPGR